jgi:hypothetical protein
LEDFARASSISYYALDEMKLMSEEVYPKLLRLGSTATEEDSNIEFNVNPESETLHIR